LSLRAESGPPGGGVSLEEPRSPRGRILLGAAAVALVAVVVIGVGAATGHLQLPFVGKPTVNYVDPVYHWTITFPKTWAEKKAPVSVDTIRYESDGGGVGIRVQGQFLRGEITPAATRSPVMLAQLKGLEGPTESRPDSTILSGPTFGTVNGAPFVHYLVTYTDFSSGVPVLLEDSDYFVFNGANLEIVTFETDAKNFSQESSQFVTAMDSFHSKYLTEGAVPASPAAAPPASPGVTATASPAAPPASPGVTATASP
jgi:hypothetical protein